MSREHVGGLIGSKGSSIREIQKVSGATVRVEPAKRGTMPSMVITGSRAQIDSAKSLIHEKVDSLVRAELRRADWLAANREPEKVSRRSPTKKERRPTPLRNMFSLLEGLPDGADAPVKVMTLDEYLLSQKSGVAEAARAKNKRTALDAGLEEFATGSPPTKRRCTEVDSMSPGSKRTARDAGFKSVASGSPPTKKRRTVTFQLGQTPKIPMLKYQNFLEAMKRQDLDSSAASDDERPTSTLSADAAEFVMPTVASSSKLSVDAAEFVMPSPAEETKKTNDFDTMTTEEMIDLICAAK